MTPTTDSGAPVRDDHTVDEVAADPAAPADLRSRAGATFRALRRALTVSDVAAIAVLTAATVHLVARDGGRAPGEALGALVVVALGTCVLLPSLRRVSRPMVWLLAAWALAPLVAVATAPIRSGMVRPLVVAAFVPGIVLAAAHLWRRPGGPRVIGAVLLVAALRSWYSAFLPWWGNSGGRPTWLALSWHNQSGTLMGAFGVAAAAVGAMVRGRGRPALLVLAGLCLAGTWLSGSRGAVVATAAGLVAMAIGLYRQRPSARAVATALGGVLLIAALAVVGLEALAGSDAAQPLTGRDESAAGNLSARVGHWEAAVSMAASRPLTGWGPGSYRWASLDHYPPDTNLTASAHNEYLEVLGEAGVVGAAPVWVAVLGVAWLVLAAPRRRDLHSPPDRRAGTLAAAAAATVLGLHAAIDFDWDYPVLLALFAIAGAVLWSERDRVAVGAATPEESRPGRQRADAIATVVAAVAVVAGLAVGVAAAAPRSTPTPWDLDAGLAQALAASAQGDTAAARAALDRVARWNAGSSSLPVVATVVDHRAGEVDDDALAAAVGPDHASSRDRLLVAGRLLEVGATDAAGQVLDELAVTLEQRRAWGGRSPATSVAGMQLAIAASDGGCASAEAAADHWLEWATTFGAEPADVAAVFAATSREGGCDLE